MSDIPNPIEDLGDSFEEMFETMEAVKGEQFAQFVGFVLNSGTLIKIMSMVAHDSIEQGEYVLADENHPLRKMVAKILNQGANMYAEALGLPEDVLKEAVKMAEAMQDKISHAEDLASKDD